MNVQDATHESATMPRENVAYPYLLTRARTVDPKLPVPWSNEKYYIYALGPTRELQTADGRYTCQLKPPISRNKHNQWIMPETAQATKQKNESLLLSRGDWLCV